MNLSKSFKNIAFTAIIVSIFVYSIFSSAIYTADAQESMSGGDYSLNGGVTVFSGQGAGGDFDLNSSGDPITGSASGGTYTFEPTPYNGDSITSGGGSDPDPESSGLGEGPSGVGYISNSSSTRQGINSPLLEKREITGVEWIYFGNGIDTNLDGVLDFDINNSEKNSQGQQNFDDSQSMSDERKKELEDIGITFKKYGGSFSTIEWVFLILFLLLSFVVPVVRSKNPRIASFAPLNIYIEYVVALHKGISLRSIYVSNTSRNIGGLSDKYLFNIHIIDSFILPISFILGAVYLWPLSWVLSILILSPILARLYVGKMLLTRI